MRSSGNPTQWGISRYPKAELLEEDIEKRRLFVLMREGRIAAAFMLAEGDEPTYRAIEQGEWKSVKPYLTVHRLASRTGEHGCGKAALEFAAARAREKGLDLRIDTHADNAPMLRVIESFGFAYCGIIHVADGSPRRAYQLNLE